MSLCTKANAKERKAKTMDWNAFIVPVVFILVELIKLKIKDKSWLPHIAVVLGMALGAAYAVYFKHDLFIHIVMGLIFGGAAAGIYDGAKAAGIYDAVKAGLAKIKNIGKKEDMD
jgi:hypothetical protein